MQVLFVPWAAWSGPIPRTLWLRRGDSGCLGVALSRVKRGTVRGPREILPHVKIPLVANAHPLQVNPGVGFLCTLEGFSLVSGLLLPDNPLNRMIEMVFLMPGQEGWQHPVWNLNEGCYEGQLEPTGAAVGTIHLPIGFRARQSKQSVTGNCAAQLGQTARV